MIMVIAVTQNIIIPVIIIIMIIIILVMLPTAEATRIMESIFRPYEQGFFDNFSYLPGKIGAGAVYE